MKKNIFLIVFSLFLSWTLYSENIEELVENGKVYKLKQYIKNQEGKSLLIQHYDTLYLSAMEKQKTRILRVLKKNIATIPDHTIYNILKNIVTNPEYTKDVIFLLSNLDGELKDIAVESPTFKDNIGYLLLREAVSVPNNQKNILALIEYGADIHYKSMGYDRLYTGETALMRASSIQGNVENVRLLLNIGADSDINVKASFPALPALISAARVGDIEIVALLIEHGAEVNIVSANTTAKNEALNRNYMDIVKILEEHGAKDYKQTKHKAF